MDRVRPYLKASIIDFKTPYLRSLEIIIRNENGQLPFALKTSDFMKNALVHLDHCFLLK